MLVLSRKKNESIVINGNITVWIVEVRGEKVRLGIDAPKEVEVHRQEVFDAIIREGRKKAAAQAFLDKLEEAPKTFGESTEAVFIPEPLRKYGG